MRSPQRGGQPLSRYRLELWLRSPRGRRWLALEERELRRALPEMFGRHVLQIGSWGRDGQLLQHSAMLHRTVLGTAGSPGDHALAEPERLPLPERSIDGIVLPHALEFSRSPHQVLREASRVLSDRGRMYILGFSPWSLWALRQWAGLRYRAFPPGARFVGVGRLYDWLELLDFEVVDVRRYGLGFPWVAPVSEHSHGLDRWLSTCAEGYLLEARKRVIPMSLVGRAQRASVRSLIGSVGVSGVQTRTPGAP